AVKISIVSCCCFPYGLSVSFCPILNSLVQHNNPIVAGYPIRLKRTNDLDQF
uniref:Ovule protein n=1 Tax=Mesocestoides corti TaxID=53468 RepID=A0A5K3FYF8_MESCO